MLVVPRGVAILVFNRCMCNMRRLHQTTLTAFGSIAKTTDAKRFFEWIAVDIERTMNLEAATQVPVSVKLAGQKDVGKTDRPAKPSFATDRYAVFTV
jgi:hypothetical protein